MGGESLVGWIEAGANLTHEDKPAIRGERGEVSWGGLARGARAIASFLRDAGLGRGDRIGLWMDKSPSCVQALLGILYAGAAYVPLDPRGPAAATAAVARHAGLSAMFADGPRRRDLPFVLRESGVAIAVVDAPGIGRWEAAALGLVARLELLDDALEFPASEPARPVEGDLAYVLYGSASAGRPRAVAHTHGSVLSFARWVRDRFGIRPDDVFASHAPFHLDLSVADLFASLGAGASLRLLSPAETMLPPYLVWMLDPWGVSVWHSVPSALLSMLEQGGLEAHPPERLRLVLLAGEAAPTARLRRLARALPDATLATLFGGAETNACTYQVIPAERGEGEAAPLPIGLACEDVEAFVLDDDAVEVEHPGAEGTLWVRGPRLMAGYWRDPALTAAVLRPDPRGIPGPACCTGARVRLLPDGGYELRAHREHLAGSGTDRFEAVDRP